MRRDRSDEPSPAPEDSFESRRVVQRRHGSATERSFAVGRNLIRAARRGARATGVPLRGPTRFSSGV